MFSEKTKHPLWRIVRKSVAQAFQANNMRCEQLLRTASPMDGPLWLTLGPC